MVQTAEKSKLSARVQRLKDQLLSATPRVDVQKIKLQLEIYRQNEGQPSIIKRAKLFNRLCAEKAIFIDDNPLVGTLTQFEYGSYPIPEFASRWFMRSETFHLQRGKASVSVEEREWINRMAEFWKDANIFTRTQEIAREALGVDVGMLQKCGCGTELTPGGFADVTPDFAGLLSKGFNGLIAEIKEAQAKLDLGAPDGKDKWYFYTAAILCLKGMITLADRYAALAQEMAAKETDPQRKRELERIAATCKQVPGNPAGNFYEALQSVWFASLGVWMESPFVLN